MKSGCLVVVYFRKKRGESDKSLLNGLESKLGLGFIEKFKNLLFGEEWDNGWWWWWMILMGFEESILLVLLIL